MYRLILFLFLIGHLLGDFYFQSEKLAAAKENSLKYLGRHSLIYFLSIFVVTFPVFKLSLLKYVLIIAIAHAAVDLMKFYILKGRVLVGMSSARAYLFDQFIHIMVIFTVVGLIQLRRVNIMPINSMMHLVYDIGIDITDFVVALFLILFIIKPCSITIKKVLRVFKSENDISEKMNAGSLIGVLERSIVLMFLFAGQFSAIGFVLTAKSIARYKRISEDKAFAEYYLIGTLLSNLLVISSFLLIYK